MGIRVISKRAGGVKAVAGEHVINIARPDCLGNPFFMKDESHRSGVIEKYRVWLRAKYKERGQVYDRLHLIARISQHANVALECWCAPCACHGDVIIEAVKGILNESI